MTNILVGQVGDTHDGSFLDGPGELHVLVELNLGHFVTTFLITLLHQHYVLFDLLNQEGTLEDVEVVVDILFDLGVLRCGFPHTENIVLLNVPNTALSDCLNRQ